MAIAFDVSTSYISGPNSVSHTWNHTCSGSNLILWVDVMNSNLIAISSVTYNGVPMTFAVADGLGQRNTLFYLVAPSTGTNAIVVTLASSGYCYTNSASYTGAKQSGQPDATTSTFGVTSPQTTTLTTTADNCWSVLGARDSTNGNTTASTNSVQREASTNGTQFYDNNGSITPPGSYSMTITFGVTSGTGMVMASFAPALTSTPKSSNFLLMGVG